MDYLIGRSKEEIREFVLECIQSWLSDSIQDNDTDSGDTDIAKDIRDTLQTGYTDTLNSRNSKWLKNMLEDELDYRIDSEVEHAYSKISLIDELSIYSDACIQYCKK